MRKIHLILIFGAIAGIASYVINTTLYQENVEFDKNGIVEKYVPDEEAPLTFCGDTIPIDSAYVKARVDEEIKILTTYRSSTTKLFNRTVRWFPQMEKILARQRVHEDIKYIAMIESNLTNVVSNKGATGFWQFMRATGRSMGLEINHEVDERYDPLKSTRAACRYFKMARKELGSWSNAAASYNLGIAGMRKQMKRQKKDSYYHLRLNKETARYLYKAIAFKEVYENRTKYGFSEVLVPEVEEPMEVYEIEENILNLIELAESEGITYTALLKFNPWLRGNTLTMKSTSKKYYIKIPVHKENYAVKKPMQFEEQNWEEEE